MTLARPAGPKTDVASERSALKRAQACSELTDSRTTSLSVLNAIRATTAQDAPATGQRELRVAEIVHLLFHTRGAMAPWLGLCVLVAAVLAGTDMMCCGMATRDRGRDVFVLSDVGINRNINNTTR